MIAVYSCAVAPVIICRPHQAHPLEYSVMPTVATSTLADQALHSPIPEGD